MPDKFTATWVSHSTISDFLQCPRAYYLKNVYKNPETNRKMQLVTPPLALGSAVHEVLESLSVLPTADRFNTPLLEKFQTTWKKFHGKHGGFHDADHETRYKTRGEEMLRRVQNNPGPLANKAVKIKEELPQYWLSETDNIILCGKIDWLEYLEETDSVHVIDFKTGQNQEKADSLQLPIYHLLVKNTQKRPVEKASYWYLALTDELEEKELPDLDEAHHQVLTIAKKIKTARALKVFDCPRGKDGCFACRDYERLINGEGELVGTNDYNQEVYILPQPAEDEEESIIL